MSTREFPSILPVPRELSDEPDCELSSDTSETLLQTDCVSKATPVTKIPLDSTGILPLLDGAIDSIEATPQVLRSRSPPPRALDNKTMNADAPISRLPTELIHVIFRYDADEHQIDCGEGLSIKTSWFRLTRVCRVWRCVVFNMPDLWRDDIFSFREKWMDILPLTKGLPLNMSLVGTSALKFVGRHDVVPLAPRAYNIRAEIRGNQDVRTLVDVLCSEPLPHLQTVALLGTRTRKREQPAAAKMARHPDLHYLTLNNIYLEPPPQGALYTLRLDMTGLYDERKPSLDTIIQALKGNTNLRTLRLHDCFADNRSKQWPPPQPCAFPYLTTFFYSHSEATLRLFGHLYLPALQFAEVHIDDLPTVDAVLTALRSVMQLWWEPPAGLEEYGPATPIRQSVSVVLQNGSESYLQLTELGTKLAHMSKETGVQLSAKLAITLGSISGATKFVVERHEGASM